MKVPGLIVIAAFLAFTPATAQQQGSITGVVRDRGGMALPGVTVEVMARSFVTEPRMAVTDAEGRYTVRDLSPGAYVLRFVLPGFDTFMANDVTVTSITPTSLDVAMRVGPIGETVRPRPPYLPRPPQAPRDDRAECLHGPNEAEAERERRLEAFDAMHLIYSVLAQIPADGRGYPDWPTLARSSAVAALKNRAGTTGELANKIQWGTTEPLPGWRIQYLYGISVEYALTDATDVCRFTLSSNDPRVIPLIARTMPLAPQ